MKQKCLKIFNSSNINDRVINLSYAMSVPSRFLSVPKTIREKCPYSELFWFKYRKIQTRTTPNTDTTQWEVGVNKINFKTDDIKIPF